MLSIAKWRYWCRKVQQEYQRVRLEREWASESGFVKRLSLYQAYVRHNQIRPHLRAVLIAAAENFAYQPLISIVMPVYNGDPRWLKLAIESVKEQIYPNWELCIADDASTRQETLRLLKVYAGERRIKISYRSENGHICKASNTAAQQADGDFIVLLDQDDVLAPHALLEIVRLLQRHPDADVIYSDEDKLDAEGNRYDACFKPDWSPTLLLGYNYINHLSCLRRTLFEAASGFREGYEGAQDYDLLLRLADRTRRIYHIPKVLYHWRATPESTASSAIVKPIVGQAAQAALRDCLARRAIPADIYQPEFAALHRLPVYQFEGYDHGPRVDIIIPTYNQERLLKRCVDSLNRTTYKNYGILIIDNESDEPRTLAYLQALEEQGVKIIRIPDAKNGFSFSRLINLSVQSSAAELLLFLNNDTEVLEPRWLSRMIQYLSLSGVGAVGARLSYPDGRLQHAGIVLGMGKDGAPGHAFQGHHGQELSYFFLAETARECAAVTGACLLTPRRVFLENGGFDEENHKISLNDVDYCLRLRQKGLRSVYVPGAELIHHESRSRQREDNPRELAQFKKDYGDAIDPYYNPNLSGYDAFSVDPRCALDYIGYLGRPLKVVFYTHNLNLEGAPLMLINLARGLKARGAVAPVLVSPMDGPARRLVEEASIPCRILQSGGTGNILQGWLTAADLEQTIARTCEFLEKEKPDVVLANVLNSFFVIEAASRQQIPSVFLIHESYARARFFKVIDPFAVSLCEAAFLKAYSVVFVSQATCELYRRYDRNRNFTIIYNALADEKRAAAQMPGDLRQIRRRLGVSQAKKLILSVGTVCERKDQETLVKAVALLSARRDDFYCLIVGAREGDRYVEKIKRLIVKLAVADKLRLAPETHDIDDYYRAADIFAFTSLIESYSLTLLEAMAFGLPIVTTPCYGVSEQVRFGTNALGFHFRDAKELADQLEKLLNDADERRRMGANSREMFSYMQDFDAMLGQYAQIIGGAWQTGYLPAETAGLN